MLFEGRRLFTSSEWIGTQPQSRWPRAPDLVRALVVQHSSVVKDLGKLGPTASVVRPAWMAREMERD